MTAPVPISGNGPLIISPNDPPDVVSAKLGLTDLENGCRIIREHGDRLRFHSGARKWLVHHGTHWELDELGATGLAKSVASGLADLVRAVTLTEAREMLARHVASCCSMGGVTSALHAASSEPGVAITDAHLDRDRALVNFTNGTLDLRLGALRPHNPDDLITGVLPYAFDPAAECPTWLAFLDRAMAGDAGTVRFLQELAGAALAADLNIPALAMCAGAGANGKSTFADTVREAMGPYGAAVDATQLLLRRRTEGATDPQLVRVRNKRFLITTETAADVRLDETRIKKISSGESIEARGLYADPIELHPSWKIVLTTNHLPVIRGTDEGIWRRIFVVLWSVSIPAAEQDIQLADKLKVELPGIMAWIVRGANRVRAKGALTVPSAVVAATAAYRASMDVVGRFVDGDCIREANSTVSSKDAYDRFTIWATENGETTVTQKEFGTRMAEHGYRSQRSNANGMGGRFAHKGLRLRAA